MSIIEQLPRKEWHEPQGDKAGSQWYTGYTLGVPYYPGARHCILYHRTKTSTVMKYYDPVGPTDEDYEVALAKLKELLLPLKQFLDDSVEEGSTFSIRWGRVRTTEEIGVENTFGVVPDPTMTEFIREIYKTSFPRPDKTEISKDYRKPTGCLESVRDFCGSVST